MAKLSISPTRSPPKIKRTVSNNQQQQFHDNYAKTITITNEYIIYLAFRALRKPVQDIVMLHDKKTIHTKLVKLSDT